MSPFISFTSIVSWRHRTVCLRSEQMQFVRWNSGFCPSTHLANLQLNLINERSGVIVCNWKNSSGNAVVWVWFLLECWCVTGALAAQVQRHCKLTASAPTETSGAAVSWTSHVSTAVGALKLSCVSHSPAHKQDLLASVQLHKSLLFLTNPGKSAMCCAVVQESVLCFPLWRVGSLPASEGRISRVLWFSLLLEKYIPSRKNFPLLGEVFIEICYMLYGRSHVMKMGLHRSVSVEFLCPQHLNSFILH